MAEPGPKPKSGLRRGRGQERLTYGGIPFVDNGTNDREKKLRKYPSVADIIAKRKSGIKEEEKAKDEEGRENTPLQVVEKMRDAIKDAQTARVMLQEIGPLLKEAIIKYQHAKTAEEKNDAVQQHRFYKKMKDYWTKFAAISWGEMYELKEKYGPGLEAAHREYMGDFTRFVHFKRKFEELTRVERALANYKPDLLGLEKGTDPRSKQLQAIAAETLADTTTWPREEFLSMIPEPGEEEEMTKAGTNLLDVFKWVYGEEEAAEAAREMQERYHGEDISAEEGGEEELETRGMSVAELKAKADELLGECEELWEHPAIQNMWFEQNLHEMILGRLREDRVLELPSTIRLLNRIAQVERNHPNTTIGVALVGDPGVGKTTVIEHYLRKKGRDYVYIDMTEEVTRYSLIGSPAIHVESQMDFYKRVSHEYGDLSDEDVLGMVRRNAGNLEKGFSSLSEKEREVLAIGMLKEQLTRAAQIDQTADPRLKELLEREIAQQGTQPEGIADQKALTVLKAQVDSREGDMAQLVQAKMTELRESLGDIPDEELVLAAQTELKSQIENAHTALRMTDEVRGRLNHVREALSRVARMKYQDEAAERFADLTKKNGWRDGLVIHALRTNKSILFDEYNAAKDWKLLHHLFTLKPGDEYQVGDKAGEKIKIPDDWRMYFTGNIQLKHGVNKLKEALVSRIGGQVLTVEPPPAHEEWLVTVASLSDANDRIVRDEKDMVLLGFLVNNVIPQIRTKIREGGSPNIVPISFRMIGAIAEQLMNHRTQFARPTSVDRAVLDEMIGPYRNYPDTQYPVTGGDTNQLPSLIAKYLVEAGLLLSEEVEDEVVAWTGISKEELAKKREGRKDQDWRKLMKEIQAKAQGAMTEMMPSSFIG